jgi:hypothetical protein
MTNRIQTLLSRGEALSWPNAIADSAPFYSLSATGDKKMNAQLTTRPVQQVVAAIQALDLESVKLRVTDPKLGEGWTREYADSIELAYKNYLTMLAKNPDDAEDILLSEDVDEFWHTHILQTMKYAEDCQSVFGNFLHHEPHVGEVTSEDLERRDAQAEKTRRLYEREYGAGQDFAWSGDIKADNAAMSGARIQAVYAAMSGARIKAENAAMSGARIRADNAAMSGARIKAANAAMSGARIQAANAAMSGARIRADNAAMSGARIQADNAAMSGARIKAANAAMSGARIQAANAAMSGARIQAANAAMSGARIKAANAAMSGARIRAANDARLGVPMLMAA